MSDTCNKNTLEPLSIIGALEKVISGEWDCAQNINTGIALGAVGTFIKLGILPSLMLFKKRLVFVSPEAQAFNIDFIQGDSLQPEWVPFSYSLGYSLDPHECIREALNDKSLRFKYIDPDTGRENIVSKKSLNVCGLPSGAFKTKWRRVVREAY